LRLQPQRWHSWEIYGLASVLDVHSDRRMLLGTSTDNV